jgi:hypothetical protein
VKARGARPLRVKLILPALTEATSPYWRPVEYSLFPPLGLAANSSRQIMRGKWACRTAA